MANLLESSASPTIQKEHWCTWNDFLGDFFKPPYFQNFWESFFRHKPPHILVGPTVRASPSSPHSHPASLFLIREEGFEDETHAS